MHIANKNGNENSSLSSMLKILLFFHTDKKDKEIFLIHQEIQMGSGAKSYLRKGFLIYEEMRKYFTIYEEDIGHI
jgi:hypothetical protein